MDYLDVQNALVINAGKAALGPVHHENGMLEVEIDLPSAPTTIDLYLLRTDNAAVNCCETSCPSARDQFYWNKDTERRYSANLSDLNQQKVSPL